MTDWYPSAYFPDCLMNYFDERNTNKFLILMFLLTCINMSASDRLVAYHMLT